MANTTHSYPHVSNVTTTYERFSCSQFVATGLTLIGEVAPSSNDPLSLDYVAVDPKGYVVSAPKALRVHRANGNKPANQQNQAAAKNNNAASTSTPNSPTSSLEYPNNNSINTNTTRNRSRSTDKSQQQQQDNSPRLSNASSSSISITISGGDVNSVHNSPYSSISSPMPSRFETLLDEHEHDDEEYSDTHDDFIHRDEIEGDGEEEVHNSGSTNFEKRHEEETELERERERMMRSGAALGLSGALSAAVMV